MKLFFYKSLLVFFLFLIAFHLSLGYLHKKILGEINNTFSKDNIENVKSKIRVEASKAIEKEVYINANDAEIINKLFEKIKSDLNQNK